MKILSDTASLFSMEEGKDTGISIVPACVIDHDQVYRDYEDISSEEFLKLIDSGAVPTSSQPAIGDLMDVFENVETQFMGLSPSMITHGGPGCVLIQAIKK